MTSKPLHVRLAVMADDDGVHCGEGCPLLSIIGVLAICALDPKWTLAGKRPTFERHNKCLAGTNADALHAAVVEAAKRKVDAWRDGSNNGMSGLDAAVDALRTADRKEKR